MSSCFTDGRAPDQINDAVLKKKIIAGCRRASIPN